MDETLGLVAHYLRSGAEQDYQRWLFVKYGLLCEVLRKAGPLGSAAADYLRENLGVLDSLPASLLVRDGTPFFWMNVQRCGRSAQSNRQALYAYSRHLVMLGFDAYFDYLPDGASVTLPGISGSDIVLPQLRIAVRASGRTAVLRRLGASTLEVCIDGRRLVLEREPRTTEFRAAMIPIPSHEQASLLSEPDPALFDEEDTEKIVSDSGALDSLAAKISRSLDLIDEVAPELGRWVSRLNKWYVPIKTANLHSTHNSFTDRRLLGVMFLSETYSLWPLLEAIVHEYHHAELYMLMATKAVVVDIPSRLFYSPWRDDARPLTGLFHAVHVFSRVEDFYSRGGERLAGCGALVAERRARLCKQLLLGLAQIPKEELPKLGLEICQFIEKGVSKHEAKLLDMDGKASADAKSHLEKWRTRYPELANEVRT